LSGLDPALAVARAAVGPFEWHVRESGFAGLVRLITEQQVSTASAAAIWKQFKVGVGSVIPASCVDTNFDFARSGPAHECCKRKRSSAAASAKNGL